MTRKLKEILYNVAGFTAVACAVLLLFGAVFIELRWLEKHFPL